MASSTLLIVLSLLHFTLSVPYSYSQSPGRLIGNNFGAPFQDLTYDYIVGTLSLVVHTLLAYTNRFHRSWAEVREASPLLKGYPRIQVFPSL